MNQILLILLKDMRRLRIETLVSIVTVAILALVTPGSWLRASFSDPRAYQTITAWFKLLVLLGWSLVIARLVQGEASADGKQPRTTPTCEWPKLLAAKLLFVTLFIYLPFLLMQIAGLLQAGFNPLSYIPNILYRLMLFSLVVLSLFAVAAVTSNLVQMAFAALCALTASTVVAAWVVWTSLWHFGKLPTPYTRIPWGGAVSIAVALLVLAAAVALQYATRRTLLARVVLGSTPLFFALAAYLSNLSLWMNRSFPPAAPSDLTAIRFVSSEPEDKKACAIQCAEPAPDPGNVSKFNKKKRHKAIDLGDLENCTSKCSLSYSGNSRFINFDENKWALVKVNVRAVGVMPGDSWHLDAFRPVLTPAKGAPVKLDWQKGVDAFDKPDDPTRLYYKTLQFLVPRAAYERIKSSPLALHLDLALTQSQVGQTWQFPLPKHDVSISGLGFCSAVDNHREGMLRVMGMTCHFPFHEPPPTQVDAHMTRGPCELAPAQPGDPNMPIGYILGDFRAAPATFALSPIEERIVLDIPNKTGHPAAVPLSICPGTSVVVTQSHKVRSVQTGMMVENFDVSAQ
jgi:hypothetical protein